MKSVPKKVNILVVDDQQRNLDALDVVLESPDYNIVQKTSAREALDYLVHEEAAVVLLDVLMPEMDGFECARRIRDCTTYNQTPIIFVSAVVDQMDFMLKGYRAGAVDYIVKPFEPEIVKAKVAVFAKLFQSKKELTNKLEASEFHRDVLQEEIIKGQSQLNQFEKHIEKKLEF